jgi:LysM repeat protein
VFSRAAVLKWLFVLFLFVVIFGGAALFTYKLFIKPESVVRAEKAAEAPPQPTPDISLPEFQAAAQLKNEGKLAEARAALTAFIQKYPSGLHVEEAKDLLGEVNTDILLSSYPSPEKQEYIVKSGDVLARIAAKLKSTPELIMRTNNLDGTMLRIGQRLLVSHPEFSLLIARKAKLVVLLDHGAFFKQYHIRHVKLAPRQPPKMDTRVAEVMAWKNGKRVGFGTKEYINSTRWIRIGAPGYVLYSEPDATHPETDVALPPAGLAMRAADLDELSSLVNGKTAVTVTD